MGYFGLGLLSRLRPADKRTGAHPMTRVAVTGGSGKLGRAVVADLVDERL